MKKLVIIFVVSASTNMIVIILQGRDELMNDKMEKVVQELRKRFRGSIEFYDVPYTEQYKIEYCLIAGSALGICNYKEKRYKGNCIIIKHINCNRYTQSFLQIKQKGRSKILLPFLYL